MTDQAFHTAGFLAGLVLTPPPPTRRRFSSVSNVLKARHDTVKNSIGN